MSMISKLGSKLVASVRVKTAKFQFHDKVPLYVFMKRSMAGHSKWHSIRHKKGAEDVKRAALFAIVGKQIKAALENGGNSPTNRSLQNALAKAKDLNVSREFIERAISRALSAKAGGITRYEGVGPCGVSFIITCITDNKNRTAPLLRHVFSKYGAELGATNSVAFRFNKVGQIDFSGIDEKRRNDFADAAISAGADDIEDKENGGIAVYCPPDQLASTKSALKDAGFDADSSDIVFVPTSKIEITEAEYDKVFSFVQELEKLDDVEDIVHDAA